MRRQEQPQQESSFVAPAVSSFEPTGTNMVPIQQGDLIQVLEQHGSGWTYAKNLSAGNSSAGWVPSWIVQAPSAASDAAPAQKTKAAESTPQPKEAQVAAKTAMVQAPRVAAAPAPAPAPAPVVETPAPVEANRNIVRATAAFAATSPSQLTLMLSDLVELVERHESGWTYGRKAGDTGSAEGWFPDWVVCPLK